MAAVPTAGAHCLILLLRNMPSMPYDDDCVYGSVPMPYRNPESCVTMPDFETVRRLNCGPLLICALCTA